MIEIPLCFEAHGKIARFHLSLDPAMKHDQWLLNHYNNRACYEAEMVWVMIRALKEGDVAVDVGANLGYFSLLMSRLVGDNGRVFSFEPVKENLDGLLRNVNLNKITNMNIIPKPLWRVHGEVTFHVNMDDPSGSCLWDPGLWFENQKSRDTPRPMVVNAVTLDGTLPDGVKLLKMDTEGADQMILEGGANMLSQHPPYILVELNPFGLRQYGQDAETFREFMRGYGYSLFLISGEDHIPSLLPAQTRVKYVGDMAVKNVLFSTLEDVAKIWPEAL